MIQRNAIVLGAVAMVLGALCLVLYVRRVEEATTGGAPVEVLVALGDLAPGAEVTEASLGSQTLPESYVTSRHVLASQLSRVLGVRVGTAVRAGEPLFYSDLDGGEEQRALARLVSEGMRAVSIEVEATSSFTGLLRPGDRVDVIHTVAGDRRDHTATVILQNVLVLATGRDLGGVSTEPTSAARQPREVTLSVSLEQSQVLAIASAGGELTLVLRNPDDLEPVDGVRPRTTRDLVGAAPRAVAPAAPAPAPPAPAVAVAEQVR